MTAIIDELCRELRNYFIRREVSGDWTIDGGAILPPVPMADGQYYCIGGSLFNDGVHRWPDADLTDETFDGTIWTMAPPRGFLELASRIAEYRAKWDSMAAEGKWTGFASESFGGYSYSLPTDAPVELREMASRIVAAKQQYRRVL